MNLYSTGHDDRIKKTRHKIPFRKELKDSGIPFRLDWQIASKVWKNDCRRSTGHEYRDVRVYRSTDAAWRLKCERHCGSGLQRFHVWLRQLDRGSEQTLNRCQRMGIEYGVKKYFVAEERKDETLDLIFAREQRDLRRLHRKTSSCRNSLLKVCGGVWAGITKSARTRSLVSLQYISGWRSTCWWRSMQVFSMMVDSV